MNPAERFLRLYRAATPAERVAGERWYTQAAGMAYAMGAHAGCSFAQAVKVLAALSPRCSWERNLANAWELLAGNEPRGLGKPIAKARAILAGRRNVLRGPKVRAFAAAILDNRNAAVIDAHMARAAGFGAKLTLTQYWYLACELREAAAEVNLPTREFQATVWLVQRNGAQFALDLERGSNE